MTQGDPVPWNELPESARLHIVELVHLLASGFTGRVEIHCNQGGVGGMTKWTRERVVPEKRRTG